MCLKKELHTVKYIDLLVVVIIVSSRDNSSSSSKKKKIYVYVYKVEE